MECSHKRQESILRIWTNDLVFIISSVLISSVWELGNGLYELNWIVVKSNNAFRAVLHKWSSIKEVLYCLNLVLFLLPKYSPPQINRYSKFISKGARKLLAPIKWEPWLIVICHMERGSRQQSYSLLYELGLTTEKVHDHCT